jgi:mono/diheme cytochrome c family protein
VRPYLVQVLALVLVAVAGGVELWHTNTLGAPTRAIVAPAPSGTNGLHSTNGPSAKTALVSFKATIAPIFRAHCAQCHLDSNASGGLQLDTYQGLIAGGSLVPGSVVQAGKHTQSILWQILQPGGAWPGGNRMPLDGRYLSNDLIQAVAQWIDQGASNN